MTLNIFPSLQEGFCEINKDMLMKRGSDFYQAFKAMKQSAERSEGNDCRPHVNTKIL